MPARIVLSDEQITAALEATGDHLSAAARLLGVCTRTLRRRLSADPSLYPPRTHPVWARALEGDQAIRAGTNPALRGNDPWTRYINLLDWEEDEAEEEPTPLTNGETAQLLSYLVSGDPRLVTPRGREPKS